MGKQWQIKLNKLEAFHFKNYTYIIFHLKVNMVALSTEHLEFSE